MDPVTPSPLALLPMLLIYDFVIFLTLNKLFRMRQIRMFPVTTWTLKSIGRFLARL